MKILVTGATGFIGRRLCQQLTSQGHLVHALCRDSNHAYLVKHPNIKVFEGDILHESSLHQAMTGCDQVYHTAALAKMWCRDKSDFYKVNVEGTRKVMQMAVLTQVQKVVYTSTCGVWGPTIKHPMTENDPRVVGFAIDYERTKYLAELEALNYAQYGLNVVVVNPSRVYGEGPITDSNTVGKMVSGYLNGKWRIIPGSGQQVANYVYLDDVVNGHIAAMQKGRVGHRYILGGQDVSFNEFFDTLQQVSGTAHRLFKVPQSVIHMYSYAEWLKAKLTGLPPVFLPEFAQRLNYDQKYSSQKAITQLGYQITPFAEGLRQTVNYIKSYA